MSDRTDPMAAHRAAQQINDQLPEEVTGQGIVTCEEGHEVEIDDDGEAIAHAVVDQFTVSFERRVNEHGVAVRRVVLRGPEEVDPQPAPTEYLIWSHHHRMWFAPNGCGYRSQITDAGRFTLGATKQWMSRGCACCPVPEVAIPAPSPDVFATSVQADRWASEQIKVATNARVEAGQVNSYATSEQAATVPA